MPTVAKDFEHLNHFIDRCESGEVKFFIHDKIYQYKNLFQFIHDSNEHDPDLIKTYPPQQINFSDGLPDGFFNDRTVRFSSFTYLREFTVYKANSLDKQPLLEYIEWIKEQAEIHESSEYKEIMYQYPLTEYLWEEGIFMHDIFKEHSDCVEFWHHQEFEYDLVQFFLNGEKLKDLNLSTIVISNDHVDINSEEEDFYAVCFNNSVEKVDWY